MTQVDAIQQMYEAPNIESDEVAKNSTVTAKADIQLSQLDLLSANGAIKFAFC